METLKEVRRRIQQESQRYSKGGKFAPIEPGIFDLVVALQYRGFKTSGSCEGHATGHRPPIPWVLVMPSVHPTPPLTSPLSKKRLKKWESEIRKLAGLTCDFQTHRNKMREVYDDDEYIEVIVDYNLFPNYPVKVAPMALHALKYMPRELISTKAATSMLGRYRAAMRKFADFLIKTR